MRSTLRLAALVLAVPAALAQQSTFPGERWMQYETPEEAGFSSARLADAYAYWETTPSAAYMVVFRGAVVVAWGDVERRYMCHSVRKSLLSGLIGAHVDAGRIQLHETLAELGIDDIGDGLTDTEKTATVFDLIRARSGVFRLAAYEPPQNPKPERHAHAPGEFWCYNNWDFNTLVTIFEQKTGAKVFEEFRRVFAEPLGMQDYRVRDGYYHYEPEKSEHPAYPFRMSARDLARFGLLYLNEGEWDGARILSATWVEDSRHPHSENAWGDAYGYMWWVSREAPFAELGAYSARGVGNQKIQVLPGAELVIVNRTDTFRGDSTPDEQLDQLTRMILDARAGEPAEEPRLVPLPEGARPRPVALAPETRARLLREWDDGPRGGVRVAELDGGLVLEVVNQPGMMFDLWPVSQERLFVEGYGRELALVLDAEDPAYDMLLDEETLNARGYAHLSAGRVAEALEQFDLACRHFPESANAWDSLGDGQAALGDLRGAVASYRRALELDPDLEHARGQLERLEKRLGGGE